MRRTTHSVDNIPYTATMIPVVDQLASGQESDVLWWALAIGADLGGNATIIGASANVILASMAEREGHPITFGAFLRYGPPVTWARFSSARRTSGCGISCR